MNTDLPVRRQTILPWNFLIFIHTAWIIKLKLQTLDLRVEEFTVLSQYTATYILQHRDIAVDGSDLALV